MPDKKNISLEGIKRILNLTAESSLVMNHELCVMVSPRQIPNLSRRLLGEAGARLVSIVATDDRQKIRCFWLRHIFSADKGGIFVHLLTKIPESEPVFPSIALEVPVAHAFEREIWEFFGLVPEGHPDLKGLILHEDWPCGLYPLRKDFVQGVIPERAQREPFRFLRVEGEGVFEIPVGPVHAGIIEPGHFRFSAAGEPIIHLEIRLGYVHKGIEKLAEGMDVNQAAGLAERISGDASFSHSLAFCQAVEKIAGVRIPKRAEAHRVIFGEMERLYNHLGDIAGIATDVGFPFGAGLMMRLRELVLQKNSRLTDHRLLRGINIPGGVLKDLTPEKVEELRSFLKFLLSEYGAAERLYLETDSLMDRAEGTGILHRKTVVDLGGVGPAARASGVDLDLRRDHPYAGYQGYKYNIPIREEGDVAARMLVKMSEFKESVSIILQALDSIPETPLSVGLGSLKSGSSMGWAESPRGETVHWLSINSEGKIDRFKIKSPSFSNWPLLSWAVKGNIVPDFPLINKSFNLSYSGNDR